MFRLSSRISQLKNALCPSFPYVMRFKSEFYNKEMCSEGHLRGLVLGLHVNEENRFDSGTLTPTAWRYNKEVNGRLLDLMKYAGPMPKQGEVRIFYNLDSRFSAVALCGLGPECLGFNAHERMDEGKEAIRIAAAAGCMELKKLKLHKIYVEGFSHSESAAEGAALGLWSNGIYGQRKGEQHTPQLDLFADKDSECDIEGWTIGIHKAAAQNLARQLQETPANQLTPSLFAQNVVQILCKSGVNVEVKVRGWIESQGMNSFLAVSRGSCEPPIFLELSYNGANDNDRPIVLIGQGNTFDSGGLSSKTAEEQEHMKGDMAGAAIVIAACRAIATMRLPINIRGLIPLCEHVMGCSAMKPGDIYKTINGKSIQAECCDTESPLMLVDTLLYAKNFFPKFVIDVGTVSDELNNTFSESLTAIFTNSEYLWEKMENAGIHSGDRVWRLPLWNLFKKKVTSYEHVDVVNQGFGHGEPCKIAAILKEFVECGQWLHMDAKAVMTTSGDDFRYLTRGMTGRPTRTLIEMIAQLVCDEKQSLKKKKESVKIPCTQLNLSCKQ